MPKRILVIEDSFVFQRIMTETLQGLAPGAVIDVAGSAAEGLAKAGRGGPDIVFLDLVLPDQDGLGLLAQLRGLSPAPAVIVVSGTGDHQAGGTVRALELGALEFVAKPVNAGYQASVEILGRDLGRAIAAWREHGAARTDAAARGIAAPAAPPSLPAPPARRSGFWVTAVASSTGGPEALMKLLSALPAEYPLPIVVVQHMPPLFTESLARSIDQHSALTVCEGRDGMALAPGRVYLAPGGRHMTVVAPRGLPEILLTDAPPECNVRPAADVLFRSLARIREARGVLAVVMTGMGDDGREGVRCLKARSAHCVAQSRESCVVYGMPRAVVDAGLADEIVDLDDLAGRLTVLAGLPAFSR
ncbi:MAG TPA: chemotaxis-specific protein-glutamate methyltransferase CheB [Candidatus Krumholzibacteria bacterium]|nr:chemotaxis-specific protein-glutamate methyltransferase CheB [Candidatus Krumholzibacteria bacterium]